MHRRSFSRLLALAAGAPLAGPFGALAQGTFPSRPLRVVVPYPAGGASDFVARLVGERLAKSLGQSVVVENRTGASGALGVGEVARSAPDGHTLALTLGDSLINNVALFKTLPYDPRRDLTLLTQAVYSPAIISANADLPVENMADFKRYAAERQGQLSYGSWGIGGLGAHRGRGAEPAARGPHGARAATRRVTGDAGSSGMFERWFVYDFVLPGTLLMESGGPPVDAPDDVEHTVRLHSCQTLTPETEHSTHYFFQQSCQRRDFEQAPQTVDRMYDMLVKAFVEDREMITAQYQAMLATPELPMHAVPLDAALGHFRGLVERWALAEANDRLPELA